MKRDEVRWTCDRCRKERLTLATSEKPPAEWETVDTPTIGEKLLCDVCVTEWRSWWNADPDQVVAERADKDADPGIDEATVALFEHVGYLDGAGFLPKPSLPVSAVDQVQFLKRARPIFVFNGAPE